MGRELLTILIFSRAMHRGPPGRQLNWNQQVSYLEIKMTEIQTKKSAEVMAEERSVHFHSLERIKLNRMLNLCFYEFINSSEQHSYTVKQQSTVNSKTVIRMMDGYIMSQFIKKIVNESYYKFMQGVFICIQYIRSTNTVFGGGTSY